MSVKHEIRARDGGTETVTLTPLTAIVALCRECLGFETDPKDCSSPLCPVFPFRTGDAHSGKTMSPENRRAAGERLRKLTRPTVESQKQGENASAGPVLPGMA